MREAIQFLEVVKAALEARLEAVNLKLLDIGLRENDGKVITPGVKQYAIVGWVQHPASGKTSMFTTRLGGTFGYTSPEDVQPLVIHMVKSLVDDFYPEKH